MASQLRPRQRSGGPGGEKREPPDPTRYTGSRLPEIPLPKFHGDCYQWPTFRDRFTALVDKRPGLSDVDKMHYLVGCLQGIALDVLIGIPVAAENYKLAWSTLANRFHRPRMVATSLIDKMLTAPVSSQESLQDLNAFLTRFDESFALLSALNIPDFGSFVRFSLAFRCLPLSTRKLFEATVADESVYPSADSLLKFIRTRIRVIENVGEVRKPVEPQKATQSSKNRFGRNPPASFTVVKASTMNSEPCPCCSGSHTISNCTEFRAKSIDERNRWARDRKLCFNCLDKSHWLRDCRSKVRCSFCSKKHHSLLHGVTIDRKDDETKKKGDTSLCAMASPSQSNVGQNVLLGTALIHARDRSGTWQTVRALIDSASQISAITMSCSNRLGLRPSRWTQPVTGLSGTMVMDVQGMVDCKIRARFAPDPTLSVRTWVLPAITGKMPSNSLAEDIKDRFSTLALADPQFHVAAPVDILLGADVFPSIVDGRKTQIDQSLPTAFSSIFGWILIGPLPQTAVCHLHTIPTSLTVSIETLMENFWAVEEPDAAPSSFTDHGWCENQFQAEHTRLPSGRFVVPLPTRQPMSAMLFPGSRAIALKRFESLERKLASDNELRLAYCNFMSEYLSLGHMSIAAVPGQYIIPHHAVCPPGDGGRKFRVVFDASAQTCDGASLNSCLHQGPKLQQDIVDILTRFRIPRYAFTSDICKMYRQIVVADKYRPLQHIFWRASPHDKLEEYELNTVTYGLNCAPFLALRVLAAIADEDCVGHDTVRNALLQQTYVDDICAGADTVDQALALQRDMITILEKSGLELKKWGSNCLAVLDAVPPSSRVIGPLPFDDPGSCSTKVLGLQWLPASDVFGCALRLDSKPVFTKRGMLSLIARIFDPLGLFSPTTFYAKHLMQRTWLSSLGWDEPLPHDIRDEWSRFVESLPSLNSIHIPRHFNTKSGSRCRLLGFCDASQAGYAAVVYIRVMDGPSNMSISLVGSKTKLSPIKKLSIPRLELNAAVLLTRWLHRIKNVLGSQLDIIGIDAWTDSSIVLSWLVNRHEMFKIYVSNRVHTIQTLLPECVWSHVPSADNPADCASRGVMPNEMASLSTYWHGPNFIHSEPAKWYVGAPEVVVQDLPEVRLVSLSVTIQVPATEWFDTFSSYGRLVRVVAWITRFLNSCRRRVSCVRRPFLEKSELINSVRVLVLESQRQHFPQLLDELAHNRPITSKPLTRLHPFIGPDGVVRVGGRLRYSQLTYDEKHPMLLAKKSHLATLLCRHWHKISCHAGPRVVTAMVSRQFWIISIRSVIHRVGNECSVCVRFDHQPPQPVMADLPAMRVQQCRPFTRVGIDFAGPLQLQETRLRKARTYKVYIAVFICFAVKATHLEVVTELSTSAFLAALDRFIARRGLPSDIFTDCGTNFVGADRQLRNLIHSPEGKAALGERHSYCSWHFNPPSAPHFGGLWEAAVRSTKRLLVRVMGNHKFTFEELTTILNRVEAVLNSRPLTPLSADPADLGYLSPGHFLIGQPLLALPPRCLLDGRMNLVNRWKLLDQCHQSFWRNWSAEYLTTLQSRSKWSLMTPNVQLNDMVVIRDNQTPPLAWRLGRVIALMPGADGVVRVVRIRTHQGELTRPVVKIVVLPTQP